MAETRTRLSSVRRYLEVFEESWKTDHDAAMQCRYFEDMLAEAIMVFQFIDEMIRRRRRAVFHALQEANPQLDEEEKQLYTAWLTLVEQDRPQLEELEKTFATVEGADRFRACVESARTFLEKWAPAVPSTAVAHRAMDLTEEDAEELRAILSDPSKGGRLKWEPRPIPNGDPSMLR
jgi:hypothetical protein